MIGSARGVIEGLQRAVGDGGTIMMPTYSGDNSDPDSWIHPPVPDSWVEEIRAEMLPYDPARTPSRKMGVVPELFRTWPGVVRSPHPLSSFAAIGPHARALCGHHPYDHRFGPASPLGRLAELGGKVLLLGAPDDTLALLHLTSHLVPHRTPVRLRSRVLRDGSGDWVDFDDIDYPWDWFDEAMRYLREIGVAVDGFVGKARATLMSAPAAVAAATDWRHTQER